ncbi:hypothetical protein EIN_174000 [Entamoeba invadens IP1]|uniref:Uncharacterized protein n=1 Tax=Entamoeba invadens IP1 TaxID=370355 RepID=A0A0A1TYS5_ENTIV|nr:hypothetical protein EIN_174000 [Entamoeba invadens IP1]ELP84725.1 hypothetical protein EIN_174000 [Entamoeba invadens IP1]|eukprot:XP_004184071.1 hypothetical protein EIN_174000 [Entamoeba invadens IP1]
MEQAKSYCIFCYAPLDDEVPLCQTCLVMQLKMKEVICESLQSACVSSVMEIQTLSLEQKSINELIRKEEEAVTKLETEIKKLQNTNDALNCSFEFLKVANRKQYSTEDLLFDIISELAAGSYTCLDNYNNSITKLVYRYDLDYGV